MIERGAETAETRAAVRRAGQTSLAMWWQLFDGMDRAYGEGVRT
jgi:hypothetical protein